MKNKIYSLFFIAVAISLGSCKKGFFDINVSPNNPADATPQLVLPSAVAGSAYVMGGYYQALGGFWSQHYAQSAAASQWADWESYNLTEDDFNRQFSTLYSGALYDYEYVREKSATSGNSKFYTIATLMQAYTFQLLADLYDKIPFTEALKGVNSLQPKYDDGQVVYDSILQRIDDAMSKDFNGSNVQDPGTSDVIFGGDMAKWQKFANTLKLKIYMRYINVDANKFRSQITALLTENDLLTSDDAKFSSFKAEQTGSNPFYNTFIDRLSGNVIANTTLMSRLTDNNDPRRSYYFKPSETGSTWASLATGQSRDAAGTTIKNYATPNISATFPVYFFTKEEVYFLIAEAQARYGTAAAAETAYTNGVNTSLIASGSTAGAITYPYNGLQSILEQKWMAAPNKRSLESFFDYNRTGYPNFLTVSITSVLNANERPKRLFYPASERKSNINTPAKVELYTPVWWAK